MNNEWLFLFKNDEKQGTRSLPRRTIVRANAARFGESLPDRKWKLLMN